MLLLNHLRKIKRSLRHDYYVYIRKDPRMKAYYAYSEANAKESLQLTFQLSCDSVVMDVGGYHGDYAAAIYCRYGCKVVVFEPVKEFYQIIRDRFIYNHDIEVVNAGAGGVRCQIGISKSHDGTSVFGKSGDVEEVQIVPLLGYMDEHGYTNVDLIAINIEGGEYELLNAMFANQELAHRFNYVLVQFHDFVENAVEMRDSIRQRMLHTHDLMWDFPFVWECWMKRVDLPAEQD